MIKLIASDLDGTLLTDGAATLNPEVYDLILALKEKGIPFIAASGRQLTSLRRLFKPVADDIFYIAENGAVCVYKKEMIVTSEIDRSLVDRIVAHLKDHPNCKPLLSGIQSSYIEAGDDEFLYHIEHFLNNKVTVVNDFSEVTEPIVKIAAQDHMDCEGSARYYQNMFGQELNVITAGNDWIDFMPYGTNKGVALKVMVDKMGIDTKDVMAFGDQQNDLEMLMTAGTSYAMITASEEVKQHATNVTDSVVKILKEIAL